MIDLLLINGTVIPMDPARRILTNGAVAVDGGRILEVGTSADVAARYSARETIDCQGQIVLPGLVDAHGHAGHSLLKTIASDTPSIWSRIITQVYQHFTTDDYWYIEGRLSALERLKAGITCGLSVIGSEPRSDDPIFAANHARAYAEMGLRAVVAVGPCSPPWPHDFSRWQDGRRVRQTVSFDAALEGAEEAIRQWHNGADGRIRVYITPFLIVASLDSSGPTPADLATALTPHDRAQSRRVRDIAARHNTRIHSDAFGGMVQLAAQDEFGLLGPDVSLQHCNGLSLAEVEILARTDTRVGHMPGPSQGRARCPVPELLTAGVTVAVVTDGTSPRTPFDLFQAARKAQLVQQLLMQDAFYLPPGKLLEMITIDAARTLGWDAEIGSLEPGKQADIILVDWDQPHLAPQFMPVHRLIYAATGGDVATVIVAGRVLMRDRRVLAADEASILAAAQAEAEATIQRAGLAEHMQLPTAFWGQPRLTLDAPRRLPDAQP
jgi:cytosine/adenosine deaminase-related metal-dependent hydrolase